MAGINAHTLKGNGRKVHFSNIDRELTLKFNLNALYFLEQQYGDIEEAMKRVQNGKIKALISITTAALSAGGNRDEPFEEDEVADLISIDDLEEISKALEDLLGKGKNTENPSKPT